MSCFLKNNLTLITDSRLYCESDICASFIFVSLNIEPFTINSCQNLKYVFLRQRELFHGHRFKKYYCGLTGWRELLHFKIPNKMEANLATLIIITLKDWRLNIEILLAKFLRNGMYGITIN
jgi:hypothetical protein